MVINDENLKARILERLEEKARRPGVIEAAERKAAAELHLLAEAEEARCDEDIYRHLINLGNIYALLKQPDDALKYFKRAAEEYPDKRFPLYAVILTLKQMGRSDEAEQYASMFEARYRTPGGNL